MAAVISGSSLASVSLARCVNARQELKAVERAQSECREGYLELARRERCQADIAAMDAFLGGAISGFETNRQELRELVDGGEFLRKATDLLTTRLGVETSDHSKVARDYARGMIEAGLAAALQQENFLRGVQLEAIFSIQRDVAEIDTKLDGIDKKIRDEVPRELLESLVLRFGHDNPDAPVAELGRFLKDKAGEWKALKARLGALEAADRRLAKARDSAVAAIEAGDFVAADKILADAEELQQSERTLIEVRRQVAIRFARAEAALLEGDADAAATHFEIAAEFFTPFDAGAGTSEGAGIRNVAGIRLTTTAKRFGGNGAAHAADLFRRNLGTWNRSKHPFEWAMTQNNLGNALSILADRSAGAEGIILFE